MGSRRQISRKLKDIIEVLKGHVSMLIVMQDHPDPDAIASAAALRDLANAMAGVQCFVAHGGKLGRAENRAMVRYLDLTLHDITQVDTDRFDIVAMVDTQPGTGNNSLPEGIVPSIVVDHHPIRRMTRSAAFTDVRSRYGATSTILYEYLQEAGIEIDVRVATALLYGIRSDTSDLGREATGADVNAVIALYPIANKRALNRIETERVPSVYFKMLSKALQNAVTYGTSIVTCLGDIESSDMLGEVAELLLRNEECRWTLCFGFHDMKLLFSIRTSDVDTNAGIVARKVAGRKGTGGGHDVLAGGQIPMEIDSQAFRRKMERMVVRRFVSVTGASNPAGSQLVE